MGVHRGLLIYLALLTLVVSVYGQVAGLGFLGFDDEDYITRNPQIQAGLTEATVAWALTTFEAGNWHPVTWLSHALDVELFGLLPTGHHLVSATLHAGNVLLVFVLLNSMTGLPLRSAAVAALFAVHPLNVESVAWVAERKNVLSTCFWLLATIAYTGYVRRPSAWRYIGALGLFALGLASKAMLVTLPFTLLLLDFWPLGRLAGADRTAYTFRRVLSLCAEKLPFVALSIVSSVLTLLAQRSGDAIMDFGAYPLTRLANAIVSYVMYLTMTFWPAGLSCFYPHSGLGLSNWKVLGSALFLTVVAGLVVAQRRQRPYLAFGWLWYLVTLLPVIGIVQVGRQAMADRYAYVPLLGIFAAAVWASAALAANLPRSFRVWIPAMTFCALLAGLTFLARRQVTYWRDDITLFSRALAVTKNNDYVHYLIAMPLFRQNRVGEAMRHLEESLRISPVNDGAHNNLGLMLLRQGEPAKAATHFRAALELKPTNAQAHNNLATVLIAEGRIEEARYHLREAIRLAPNYASPRRLLAEVETKGRGRH